MLAANPQLHGFFRRIYESDGKWLGMLPAIPCPRRSRDAPTEKIAADSLALWIGRCGDGDMGSWGEAGSIHIGSNRKQGVT